MSSITRLVGTACVATFTLSTISHAASTPSAATAAGDDAMQRMQEQLDELKRSNESQAQEIDALKSQNGESWLTAQRAQQIRGIVTDALSDSSTRTSFQSDGATAGYDKNFFMASADGNYRLNIEGQLQSRFAYSYQPNNALTSAQRTGKGDIQNEYGFELRRVKLNFFGHVFDPSWTYRIQFAYERDGQNSGQPLSFEDVFVQKALGEGFFVRMGQWKNIFNVEENTSSRTQQFAERSVVNQYFSTKFTQGILLGWESEDIRAYGSYNDGGGNRNLAEVQGTGNPTSFAFTGRAEYRLDGAWGQFKDMQGWRGSPFAAMIGAGMNWQRAGGVPPSGRRTIGNGQLSPTQTNEVTLLTYTADLNLRGDGWSFWTAFLGNYLYNGGSTARDLGVEGALSYGAVAQGGVFVTDALELIARYEYLGVDSHQKASSTNSALSQQSLNIATVGFNYYFNKNAVKFTLDGGYAFNAVQFSNGLFGESIAGADWRATNTGEGNGEVVLRAQMQLLF